MDKNLKRQRRKKRIRAKVTGTKDRPRLSVFRSNKYIYAQFIDDVKGNTLLSLTGAGKDEKIGTKIEQAKALGKEIAVSALKKKIKEVVFDRNAYKFHGRVKALAEGAKEGGLKI